MKDSYVLRPEMKTDKSLDSDTDWVVIRRRKAPGMAVEEATAPEPVTNLPEPAEDISRGAEPKLRGQDALASDSVEETTVEADDTVFDVPAEGAFAAQGVQEPSEPRAPFALGADHAVPAEDELLMDMYSPQELWAMLPRIQLGARLDGRPARGGLPSLIEYFRADPIAKGFDLLRTRLVRTIRAYGWRQIAIVSPTPGCGTTFTAVNLALSLSRVPGSRTILMDMNQRSPGVAEALGVRHPHQLDAFLSGKSELDEYLVRPGETLAVGLSDAPNPLASEMLYDPLTGVVLDEMIDALDPDLVIYDLPPMLSHDDLAAFLPQVDGVLLVADGTQTLPEHISACERILEGQTQLLGVVLNRGRAEGNADLIV
ncbi:CpsD/CapB family tyrosine-protein kinase [Aestuariivita boseongensis]|uniref:CpsD/CapB family tyrosine-protein kinase n=1 Tax=Aestuariivita boseongensis TaxID=1470562 RepID=UPI000681B80B|nr:CpsD/CapB family tyrosine-protein kinase [Aestuariivita boseongensis]